MSRCAQLAVALLCLGLWFACSGCGSPRQKALKAALRDYQRASAGCAAYAREQVAGLSAAAQAFHAEQKRWPNTSAELGRFVVAQREPQFDPFAFAMANFALMPDGSLQIHYEVNCASFNTRQHTFTQRGTTNVRPR